MVVTCWPLAGLVVVLVVLVVLVAVLVVGGNVASMLPDEQIATTSSFNLCFRKLLTPVRM